VLELRIIYLVPKQS